MAPSTPARCYRASGGPARSTNRASSGTSAASTRFQHGWNDHGPVKKCWAIPTYELPLPSAFGGLGGQWNGGVEQRACDGAGCGRCAGIVIHPGGDGGPIVEQHELSCELFRVTRAGLFCEIGEQRPKPRAMGLRNFPNAGALGRLGAGTRERAPVEARVPKRETLYVEDAEKPL